MRRLEEIHDAFGAGRGAEKLDLLGLLERDRFPSARQVARLHEALLFLRAYPDDAQVLERAERLLAGFPRRSDLRRHREALADSGIAGTPIHYRFYWVTARWLARRWPGRLSIDWAELERGDELRGLLDLLLPYSESPALDGLELTLEEWIARLKGPAESDASFLIGRFDRLKAGEPLRERLYERIDVPIRLAPGRDTPSRTLDRLAGTPVVFQRRPLPRERPDLRREVRRRPASIEALSTRRGRAAIDLARSCMVTRSRDLDAFAWADARDVRLATFDGGLQFAVIGVLPERRFLLETLYGFLMIRNGVPIGYTLSTSFFGSSELAFNLFDTFRGGEAGRLFARFLALTRHLFGSDAFAIDPYQLGLGNAEGLRSGAWWFYYKLGFRPVDRDVRRVLRSELARMRADPVHRSSIATLRKLAADYVYLYLGRPRRSVLGRLSTGKIGLRISKRLAGAGGDRERALRECSRRAAERFGRGAMEGWSPSERQAWERWAPLLAILPRAETWSRAEKRALVRVVRAKGGRSEADYLRLLDRHAALRAALLRLAR